MGWFYVKIVPGQTFRKVYSGNKKIARKPIPISTKNLFVKWRHTMPKFKAAIFWMSVALLATTCQAGEGPKSFEGTWVVQALTFDGEMFPDKEFANVKLVLKENTFKAYKGPAVISQGTFKVDPKKKPKTLDVFGESEGKKYKLLAIYKMEDDTLTVCSAEPGAKMRPEDFTSPKGSKRELTVYKRKP